MRSQVIRYKKSLLIKPGSVLLSHTLRCSTIGAEQFHFRVRDGIGWFMHAIATRLNKQANVYKLRIVNKLILKHSMFHKLSATYGSKNEIEQKTIELLVPVSFMCYHTSTPGLSTWQSSTALMGNSNLKAGFPLRCFQRLSLPYLATQRCSWQNNWYTRGTSNSVLSY